jgi:NADH/F420H2 dehydrogenase subunit C
MSEAALTAISPAAERVRSRIGAALPGTPAEVADRDLPTIETEARNWPSVARFLRDDPEMRFDLLIDLLGVDNLRRRGRPSRFEMVVHLYSTSRDEHVRARVILEGENPEVPSVVDEWPAANWFEREAFDLFGFRFSGHPNLRRILCHQAFVGHALRKDYPAGQRWMCTEDDLYVPDLVKRENEEADQFETVVVNSGRPIPRPTARSGSSRAWTASRSSRPNPRSDISTAASRRWPRRTLGTRSFRTPTG